MVRPCYLVVDREYSGRIFTRKLVIESAKFNVLTAYSSHEAIETLRKFPAVEGIVLDAGMTDMPCQELMSTLRDVKASIRIILVGAPGHDRCDGSDYYIESFQPVQLLKLLQKIQPDATSAVERRNEELKSRNL